MIKVHTIFYVDFKDDPYVSLKFLQFASVRTITLNEEAEALVKRLNKHIVIVQL